MRHLLIALALFATPLLAVEGKWTPQQVTEIDPAWLKAQGLEIEPSRLWDPKSGTGLLASIARVGTCSSGFVSPDGLLVTNHHCVFSMVQQHSTPERDLITDGYIARTRQDELHGKALRATLPRRFTDVTTQVLTSIPRGANDLQRRQAIDAKSSQLVAKCEQQKSTRCQVASFDGGLFYTLIEATEFPDVRLVYAPPLAVGEYGGEVDNWSWPRHTGDISLARIYTAPDGSPAPYDPRNVPYKSSFYYPMSTAGVRAGDFVMGMGYPRITYRALIAPEMSERRDLYFARREEVFGEWIAEIEEATKKDPAGAIVVADTLKTLLNKYKNAQGQLAGFARGKILEKQQAADDAVLAWIERNPKPAGARQAYRGLEAMVAEQRATWERDFLLEQMPRAEELDRSPGGPKLLSLGTMIARRPTFASRDLPRLRDRVEREQNSFFAPADKRVMLAYVRRALALPPGQRIASIDRAFGSLEDEQAIAARIEELYTQTRLGDLAERLKMWDESPAQLRARKDPLLDLAIAITADMQEMEQRRARWEGTVSRLRPLWRQAVIAHAGKPVAPDANETLRITFGTVRGYEPQEAVIMEPLTTVGGMLAKHTGEEPFDLPRSVLQAERSADVPLNFLADLDTTGGNSGSPVVNGKGELVGVNFDRVWENVANDFAYNPDVARNISVDIRFLIWMLENTPGADAVQKELGLRE
jgi:hypothetical protein